MAWLSRFDDFNASCDNELSENKYKAAQRMTSFVGSSSSKKSFPPKIQLETNSGQDIISPPRGYHRINDITTHLQSVSIIGVIIAKDGPKTFLSKKGGNERHLLALTVRDSPSSFINVTCWCCEEFIKAIAPVLNIGTVVDIKGANVQAKSNNPSDDKFKPWTPSLCQLNLSDNQGTIGVYQGPDVSYYLQLLNIPTKANNDFYTLEDIQANGMSLNGEHINILAAIKKIWPVRNIVTKTGVNLTKADIIVCDETCPSFSLTLWGNCVQLTEKWVPMESVVFASDVRISFNDFRSTMVANTDSKTVITTSPDTYEALSLQEFIRSQSSMFPSTNEMDQFPGTSKDPDVESITKVLTVRQIKDLQRTLDSSGENTDYAVTYAFLSQFDCDSDNKTIFKDICSRCKKPVQESTGFICGNPACAGGDLNFDGGSGTVEYRLSVTLSDHTGSLEFCGLSIQAAEDMLGYKANEYKNLAALERTNIKWNYLLERVRAVLKITKLKKGNEHSCYIKVISIRKATPAQLLEQGFMDI